jgi:hypothetical protein
MSEIAIADVGRTLVELLVEELRFTPNSDEVTLASPAEIQGGDTRLSLFLYSIIENPNLKNAPREIITSKVSEPPPLTLDLYYLLTSYASDTIPGGLTARLLEAQEILGKAMRVFYDNGIISGSKLRGTLGEMIAELHVTLNPITVEDLTRIWSVFPEEAYRTSVSYVVTPVPIKSRRRTESQRVVARQTDHDHMLPRR